MADKPWWQGPRGEWYVVFQFLLFALVALGPTSLPGWPAWPPPWSTTGVVVGIVLGGIGALLILAGVLSLGRNLTAVPHPKDDATLVEKGVHGLVRHPIYSGILFGAFGWAFLRNGTLTLLYALILFLFFDLKTRREEKWLSLKFPEYKAYQQRVRKLIPFLY